VKDDEGSSTSMSNDRIFQQHYSSFARTLEKEAIPEENRSCFYFKPLYSLRITDASLFSARKLSDLPKVKRVFAGKSSSKQNESWQDQFVREWKEVLLK
jgi:hypothetical protein